MQSRFVSGPSVLAFRSMGQPFAVGLVVTVPPPQGAIAIIFEQRGQGLRHNVTVAENDFCSR